MSASGTRTTFTTMKYSPQIAVALACLCVLTSAQYDSDVTNRCPQVTEEVLTPPPFYYGHPDNCNKFISCAFGLPYVLECPKSTVWSDEKVSCVHETGPYNNCNVKPPSSNVCTPGSPGLIPHPKHCQRYYNCSDVSVRPVRSFLEAYEMECTYPDLFDSEALRCAPYNEALCAEGAVAGVSPCDYVQNLCPGPHCAPCKDRFPSCVGQPDGLNEHYLRVWSPHHVRCENERSMEFLWCPKKPEGSPFFMLFSPEEKQCVHMWQVSREHNGFAPECEEGSEGFFTTTESDQVYYQCPGADVFFCDEGHLFNAGLQKCVPRVVVEEPTTISPELIKPEACIGASTELVPHPGFCQRYYNCSDSSPRGYRSPLGPYEVECDYPDLFDVEALKCVPYLEANCAPEAEVGVSPCDYVVNLCVAAHCQPCKYRLPSCVGKTDGVHEHDLKLNSPYHVRCENERSMEFLFCDAMPAGSLFHMIFSPDIKQCINQWSVPRDQNGLMPQCQAGDDGFYVTPESDRVYYQCPGADVFFCGAGHVFSADDQGCVPAPVEATTMGSSS